MDTHSVVDDWDTVPFDGGFDGIDTLASRGFSGAVETGGTWLFLRDGEALAVVSDPDVDPKPGDIDAFENATGRRYEAPTPGVAALAAMLALDGDVRGRYFTDDTPLDTVDETLSGGGFTGYVELSENVLSGDYYYVYVDGEVEHVGFVGSSQFLSGEEAESKATGEVGIYDVVAVELPRPELPEPAREGSQTAVDDGEAGAPDGTEPVAGGTLTPAESDPTPTEEPDRTAESDPTPTEASDPADAEGDGRSTGDSESPEGSTTAVSAGSETTGTAVGTEDNDEPTEAATSESDPRAGAEDSKPGGAADASDDAAADPSEGTEDDPVPGAVTNRTVPSLDPEDGRQARTETRPSAEDQAAARTEPSTPSAGSERADPERPRPDPDQPEAIREELASELERYESQLEELASELDDSNARIESLEAELESVRTERDELRDRLDSTGGAATSERESRTPAEALAGTRLFVRENSRGEGTLSDVQGGADRESVVSNLRIEYHTEFDDDTVAVDGEPFEPWLRSSERYAFTEWLAFELPFEIRSTNAVEGVRPLYNALPGIDRIGFAESIAVGDGTEGREVEFDLVARNKKGEPLVVVTFDDGRDPTRAETIEPLVTDASDVCADHGTLAGAVAITSSYFESDAMTVVGEATGTSLLSRSRYRSYVKLSRTNGYHLCLVESRDGSFNLTVPEL